MNGRVGLCVWKRYYSLQMQGYEPMPVRMCKYYCVWPLSTASLLHWAYHRLNNFLSLLFNITIYCHWCSCHITHRCLFLQIIAKGWMNRGGEGGVPICAGSIYAVHYAHTVQINNDIALNALMQLMLLIAVTDVVTARGCHAFFSQCITYYPLPQLYLFSWLTRNLHLLALRYRRNCYRCCSSGYKSTWCQWSLNCLHYSYML